MSKLDRQIDLASANPMLKIIWREFDDVDVEAIRKQLLDSIASAESRIPLDCRDVDGAPEELVELLLDANEVAKGCRKRLILSYASDHLRQALRPGVHRREVRDPRLSGVRIDAATAAAESLRTKTSFRKQPETKPAPVITAAELTPNQMGKWKRSGRLAAFVAAGTFALVCIEWYVIYFDQDTVIFSEFVPKQKTLPIKIYEETP